jgi:two-component system response regulator HydG
MPVLIMTAYGTIENAVEAIKKGAFHYLTKPLDTKELGVFLERAFAHRRNEISRRQMLRDIQERYTFESMVGRSASMRRVFEMIDRVADGGAFVLVTGESGTGKELVARAIHFRGERAERPFVAMNCAAIPAQLLESELFGHETGAFTGASKPRAGLAVEASGGTLFLDEVGELPLELQPKLLRLLQEGEVRPLGSNVARRVDLRVVSATNVDLLELVKSGRFRKDLYYRLNVVPIEIPPLRERVEDIPILAERLLQRVVKGNPRIRATRIARDAVDLLERYPWPGNVRELENVLERAATLCRGEEITTDDLRFLEGLHAGDPLEDVLRAWPTLRDLERRYIARVLEKVGGSKVKAAQILGVDASTLYRRETKDAG